MAIFPLLLQPVIKFFERGVNFDTSAKLAVAQACTSLAILFLFRGPVPITPAFDHYFGFPFEQLRLQHHQIPKHESINEIIALAFTRINPIAPNPQLLPATLPVLPPPSYGRPKKGRPMAGPSKIRAQVLEATPLPTTQVYKITNGETLVPESMEEHRDRPRVQINSDRVEDGVDCTTANSNQSHEHRKNNGRRKGIGTRELEFLKEQDMNHTGLRSRRQPA